MVWAARRQQLEAQPQPGVTAMSKSVVEKWERKRSRVVCVLWREMELETWWGTDRSEWPPEAMWYPGLCPIHVTVGDCNGFGEPRKWCITAFQIIFKLSHPPCSLFHNVPWALLRVVKWLSMHGLIPVVHALHPGQSWGSAFTAHCKNGLLQLLGATLSMVNTKVFKSCYVGLVNHQKHAHFLGLLSLQA